jgi:protein gp37
MGEFTGIGWTLRTWNPFRGCKKISPGCAHCYMFTEQYRFGLDPTIVTKTKTWNQPKRWQKKLNGTEKKELVFTCSWSDFFIEQADVWRPEIWQIIKACPNLIFQVLTKRSENIQNRLPLDWGNGYDNVALGVSVENDKYYNRIKDLIAVPAKWHFISAEPLLGSVKDMPLEDVEWVICGGESGPHFRNMNLDWAREIRNACLIKKIPFFFKQNSNLLPGKDNIIDGRVWEQWPKGWL